MKRFFSFLRRLLGTSSPQRPTPNNPLASVTNDDRTRLQEHMTMEDLLRQASAVALSPAEQSSIKQVLLEAMYPKRRSFFQIRLFTLKGLTSVIASFLIITLAGGSVSYAAESAVPGEFLYPVKIQVNERVLAALAQSPEARARFAAQRAERRLGEAETLASSSSLNASQSSALCKNFEAHVQAMETQIQAMVKDRNLKNAHDLSAAFETSLLAHSSLLAMLSPKGTSGAEMLDELTGDIDKAASRNAEAHVAMDLAMSAAPDGTGWDLAELAETLSAARHASEHLQTTLDKTRSSLPASTSRFVDRKLSIAALALEAANSQKGQTKKSEQLARSALKTMKEAELGMMLHVSEETETGSEDLQELLQEDVNLVFRHFANTHLRVTDQKLRDTENDLRGVSAATGSTVTKPLEERPDRPLLPIETHMEGAKQLMDIANTQLDAGDTDEAVETSNTALKSAEKAHDTAEKLLKSIKEKKENKESKQDKESSD